MKIYPVFDSANQFCNQIVHIRKQIKKIQGGMTVRNLSNDLSQQDMQQFLRALSERNENAFIQVPTEIVQSVKKVGGTFIAQLLTGDSLMLGQQQVDVQANTNIQNKGSIAPSNNITKSVYDPYAHVEVTNFEKDNAVAIVKATNELKSKGVNINGFSSEEIMTTYNLIKNFTGISDKPDMKGSTESEQNTAKLLSDIWIKE